MMNEEENYNLICICIYASLNPQIQTREDIVAAAYHSVH